jgi:hypothetical protein
MTVKHVINIINSATMIKRWPTEYYVYSDSGFVMICCDKNGQVVEYPTNLDNARYKLNAEEKKLVQAAIDAQIQRLGNRERTFANRQKLK